ncbi:hypothetical protein EVAR_100544_1 [Eumeta japonica]|uniref:Uncharacterized protein n=1 Tax=Eumeta variegata TaxID=151549 RepID=A0A4C1ZPR9_EUMVA|nr:hypothetical protein EVAR_100544_1 [Eumeta japonica]
MLVYRKYIRSYDLQNKSVTETSKNIYLRMAVSVITGHCTFGNHAKRLTTTSVEVAITRKRRKLYYISLTLVRRWRTTVSGFCRKGFSMTCLNWLRSVWVRFVRGSGWLEPA